ncbi:MAG: hypothetical protein ACK4IT_01770 [Thioalkalivibrionaceae bacterium]
MSDKVELNLTDRSSATCLIDSHVHYRDTWARDLPPEAMLTRLANSGISGAFVMSESPILAQTLIDQWLAQQLQPIQAESNPFSSSLEADPAYGYNARPIGRRGIESDGKHVSPSTWPVPFPWLDIYQNGRTSQNWWQGPLAPFKDDLEILLNQAPRWNLHGLVCAPGWAGIGEIHLQADNRFAPRFEWLMKHAEEINRPVILHVDPVVIDRAYEIAPNLDVIWAHAGPFPHTDLLSDYLRRYPRLRIDVSMRAQRLAGNMPPPASEPTEWAQPKRHSDEMGDGTRKASIASDWETLIFEYSDRVLVGSDTFNMRRWERLPDEITAHRYWLDGLSPSIRPALGYINALDVIEPFSSRLKACFDRAPIRPIPEAPRAPHSDG